MRSTYQSSRVSESSVAEAIESLLLQEGFTLENINFDHVRARLGGGSKQTTQPLITAYKQRILREKILKGAQDADAESLFANASSKIVSLMRELHIAGIAGISSQNDKLAQLAATAETRTEASAAEKLKLQAAVAKLRLENKQLQNLNNQKADTLKSLTAEHARLKEENDRLTTQNDALLQSFTTLSNELGHIRKTPQLMPKDRASVHPIREEKPAKHKLPQIQEAK